MEVYCYFPSSFLQQMDLELVNHIPKCKWSIRKPGYPLELHASLVLIAVFICSRASWQDLFPCQCLRSSARICRMYVTNVAAASARLQYLSPRKWAWGFSAEHVFLFWANASFPDATCGALQALLVCHMGLSLILTLLICTAITSIPESDPQCIACSLNYNLCKSDSFLVLLLLQWLSK